VAEQDKFVIEDFAVSQTADMDDHSCAALDIEARLRAIRGIEVNERLDRRAGQFQFLRLA
jgi:hypothetical protein